MLQRKRVNAFSAPRSNDQISAAGSPVLMTTLFYIIVANVLVDEQLTICLAVHIPLSVLLLVSWLYVELVDPGAEGGISCVCMKESQSTARYCGSCRKTVYGMDHHCGWLNTCIGKKNYAQFYCVITTAFWSMAMNVVVGALLYTSWNTDAVNDRAEKFFGTMSMYRGLVIVMMAYSCLCAVGLGSLYFFHTYLVFVAGKGTYDWLIDRRNKNPRSASAAAAGPTEEETKQQADIEARREKERQEWVQNRAKKRSSQEEIPVVEMTPRSASAFNNSQDNAV